MKRTTLIIGLLVATAFVSFSFIQKPAAADTRIEAPKEAAPLALLKGATHDHKAEALTLGSRVYDSLQLDAKGLSKTAFALAVQGYLSLLEAGKLNNPDFLTVVDFSQSSRQKRFYLLDMKNGKLLENTYVSHGKNSGVDMATDFSNTVGSEKSSIGFYVTQSTYTGKNGFSLRMEGLDKGFNDHAAQRAIVVHGADYVNASRVQSPYMGRSQGCPALPRENYKEVISQIKDGAAFFIYYPSEEYVKTSTVLNS